MSEIARKYDAKQAEMIRAKDERGRGGSSLLAPEDLEEYIGKVIRDMRSPIQVAHGTTGKSIRVPRLGLISLILSKVNVRVYGDPVMKRIAKTAFTDGSTIYLCEDLLDKVNEEVRRNEGVGAEWIIMHEVMHVMRNHVQRFIVGALGKYPHDVMNQATDLLINTQLSEAFPDYKPVPSLKAFALGFKPGDKERWMNVPETVICDHLMYERRQSKKREMEQAESQQGPSQPQDGSGGKQQPNGGGGSKGKPDQKGKGGKGQKGQGSGGDQEEDTNDPLSNLDDPEAGGQGENDPSQGGEPGQKGQGRGRGKPQQGQPQGGQGGGQGDEGDEEEDDVENDLSGDFGADDDRHFVDPQELADILQQNGMDKVRERLGLPEAEDNAAHQKFRENASRQMQEAIQDAASQMYQAGGSFPGAHMVHSAVEMVRGFTEGKITWKLPVQDLVLSSGHHVEPIIDEPNDIYYVPGIGHTLGVRPWLPSISPAKSNDVVLWLIDSSGSMSTEALIAQTSEALELKTAAANRGDKAAAVFLWACDSMLRGEPQEINDNNVQDFIAHGLELRGRGGTSIDTCINQALASPILADKNVRAIIYGSDLLDSPVPRPHMLDEHPGIKVLFLADPEIAPQTLHTFSRGTDWADIYVIDDGLEIDLENVGNDGVPQVVPAKAKVGRPRR